MLIFLQAWGIFYVIRVLLRPRNKKTVGKGMQGAGQQLCLLSCVCLPYRQVYAKTPPPTDHPIARRVGPAGRKPPFGGHEGSHGRRCPRTPGVHLAAREASRAGTESGAGREEQTHLAGHPGRRRGAGGQRAGGSDAGPRPTILPPLPRSPAETPKVGGAPDGETNPRSHSQELGSRSPFLELQAPTPQFRAPRPPLHTDPSPIPHLRPSWTPRSSSYGHGHGQGCGTCRAARQPCR